MGRALAFIDFETTGLSPESGDRLIEVGVAVLESQRIVDRYQSLINPGISVPFFITELTGIRDSDVRKAPSPASVSFRVLPPIPTVLLAEPLRHAVLDYLVEDEAITEEFAHRLLSWKHSGFSVDNTVGVGANDPQGRRLTQITSVFL